MEYPNLTERESRELQEYLSTHQDDLLTHIVQFNELMRQYQIVADAASDLTDSRPVCPGCIKTLVWLPKCFPNNTLSARSDVWTLFVQLPEKASWFWKQPKSNVMGSLWMTWLIG